MNRYHLASSINVATTIATLFLIQVGGFAQSTINRPSRQGNPQALFQKQMDAYDRKQTQIMNVVSEDLISMVAGDVNEANLMKKQHSYADVMDSYRRAIRKLQSRAAFNYYHDIVYPVYAQDPRLAPMTGIKHGVKIVYTVQDQIESLIKQTAALAIGGYVTRYKRDMGEYAVETGHYRTALKILLPINNPQTPDSGSNLALTIACLRLNNYTLARKVFDATYDLSEFNPNSKSYMSLKTAADLAGMVYLASSRYYASDKELYLRYAQDAWRVLPQNAYIAFTYANALQANHIHPLLQIKLYKSCKSGLDKWRQSLISSAIYVAQLQHEQKHIETSSVTAAVNSQSSKP